MDKILILDFGSQTTQLIGRRVRDLGVYAEILPGDAPLSGEVLADVRGLILSGSPESVYTPEGPVPDKRIYDADLPLLGICYGLQRMTFDQGGKVEPLPEREYGAVGVRVTPLRRMIPPGRLPGMGSGPGVSSRASIPRFPWKPSKGEGALP